MNAGKWVAIDRGAFNGERPAEITVVEQRFPLADRLREEDFQALILLRATLPAGEIVLHSQHEKST